MSNHFAFTHALTAAYKMRGFNLVEAAIVLGVVGMVIGGIWVAASEYNERRRILRTVEQLSLMANCLRNITNGSEAISGNAAVFFVSNVQCLPGDMRSYNTGNGWAIESAYHNDLQPGFPGNNTFNIQFKSMPNKECNILMNAVTTKFGNSGQIMTRARGYEGGGMQWFTASQFPLSIHPSKCGMGTGAVFEFSIPYKP